MRGAGEVSAARDTVQALTHAERKNGKSPDVEKASHVTGWKSRHGTNWQKLFIADRCTFWMDWIVWPILMSSCRMRVGFRADYFTLSEKREAGPNNDTTRKAERFVMESLSIYGLMMMKIGSFRQKRQVFPNAESSQKLQKNIYYSSAVQCCPCNRVYVRNEIYHAQT